MSQSGPAQVLELLEVKASVVVVGSAVVDSVVVDEAVVVGVVVEEVSTPVLAEVLVEPGSVVVAGEVSVARPSSAQAAAKVRVRARRFVMRRHCSGGGRRPSRGSRLAGPEQQALEGVDVGLALAEGGGRWRYGMSMRRAAVRLLEEWSGGS